MRSLRSIALFEASKGLIVLLAGFGLFSLAHRDIQVLGEQIVRHLHLNPAHETPRIFLHALSRLQDANLLMLSIGAVLYSAMRFAEAYGLWLGRAWAEWMAIVSTGLYLPVEVYETWTRRTLVTVVITVLNAGLFLVLVQIRQKRHFTASAGSAG